MQLSTRILFLNTNQPNLFPSGSLGYSIRTVNPCPSVCPKHSIFERFVFKEKIRVHPSVWQKHSCYSSDSCSKKICVHLCHLWENKIIIRVQKKAVHPSPTHQCWTQADHLYLISHARRLPFPSPNTTITITPLHHFTTFLPFTIYIPWGKPLIPAPVAIRLPSRV